MNREIYFSVFFVFKNGMDSNISRKFILRFKSAAKPESKLFSLFLCSGTNFEIYLTSKENQ